jgi:hypothetical protein
LGGFSVFARACSEFFGKRSNLLSLQNSKLTIQSFQKLIQLFSPSPQSKKCFCKPSKSFRWSLLQANKNYFSVFWAFHCYLPACRQVWARAIVFLKTLCVKNFTIQNSKLNIQKFYFPNDFLSTFVLPKF